MKSILFAASLLILGLSACPAALPPSAEPIPQATAASSQPPPEKDPLVITSETKAPNLPEILFPGLELKVIAGTGEAGYRDGPALEAQFNRPIGLAMNETGELFIADSDNHCVRKLNLERSINSVLCQSDLTQQKSEGILINGNIKYPSRLVYIDKILFLRDFSSLYSLKLSNLTLTPIVTSSEYNGGSSFFSSVLDFLSRPAGITVFNKDILITIGNTIKRLNLKTTQIEHIAGDQDQLLSHSDPYQHYINGSISEAKFNAPGDIIHFSSNRILISDSGNQRIRLLDFGTNPPNVSTFAGKEWDRGFGHFIGGFRDGSLNTALFNGPGVMAIGPQKSIWISEAHNRALRIIFGDNVITLVKNARFSGLYFFEGKMYLSDSVNHRIYEMDLSKFDFDQLTPQVLENELH